MLQGGMNTRGRGDKEEALRLKSSRRRESMTNGLRLINGALVPASLLNFQNVHFICRDPLTAGVLAGIMVCNMRRWQTN